MLKEGDIKSFLEEKRIAYNEKASIYGIMMGKGSYLIGALDMDYYILHFNDKGIAIIGVNAIGNLEKEVYEFIPFEEVRNIKFNKKIISYKLEIETDKGICIFRVNNFMIGVPWHKENLIKIKNGLNMRKF